MDRRLLATCGTLLAVGLTVAVIVTVTARSPELPFEKAFGTGGAAVEPMVSWREPEQDRARLFPGATAEREEGWVLSGGRLQLQQLLGRPPKPDEYLLHLHQVLANGKPLGAVVVRRIKGSSGALELVIALTPENRVQALRFQRSREPEPVKKALEDPAWLASFVGRDSHGDWTLGHGVRAVAGVAAAPAQGVADAVQSTLAMAEIARTRGLREAPTVHH